ncbi:MAG: hypothetical protein ACLFVG_08040, partial [Candidatus Aminicenantes bacterium]
RRLRNCACQLYGSIAYLYPYMFHMSYLSMLKHTRRPISSAALHGRFRKAKPSMVASAIPKHLFTPEKKMLPAICVDCEQIAGRVKKTDALGTKPKIEDDPEGSASFVLI